MKTIKNSEKLSNKKTQKEKASKQKLLKKKLLKEKLLKEKLSKEKLFEELTLNEKVKYFLFYGREFLSYLRKVFVVFGVSFVFFYGFFQRIFNLFFNQLKVNNVELIYHNIFEIFFFRINFSLYLAFMIIFPLLLFYLTKFIKPALYKKEKKILFSVFVLLIFFFYFSIIICYKFIIPYLFKIIMSLNQQMGVKIYLKITDYLSNFLFLSICIGILSQIPILLIVLLKFNLISTKFLEENRKIVIMIIFILSGIFTPPDAISQIIFGIIIYLLFEIIIFFFKRGQKSRK